MHGMNMKIGYVVRKADKLTTVSYVYTCIAAGVVRVLYYMTGRKYRGVLCRDQVIMRASPSAEPHLF